MEVEHELHGVDSTGSIACGREPIYNRGTTGRLQRLRRVCPGRFHRGQLYNNLT